MCQNEGVYDWDEYRWIGQDPVPIPFTLHEKNLVPADYYNWTMKRWVDSTTIDSAGGTKYNLKSPSKADYLDQDNLLATTLSAASSSGAAGAAAAAAASPAK